ncbi:hypothetical protein DQ04_05331030 [Trypanosoma grayi]|uniref:hypothetical protein n=1 Tax=Trypanosoma grayi TaxID=71804 RepID=UPI0004F40E2D|nr:hypothetical protein DQ04_05331030 [Trypanosoma grayi]KEG09373.1 hypothetical protein DQ04_05331030 [Trypanosoma grayi]
MTEKNWALGESGAKVAEVSHEATHVASAAANLLVEREDLLWITGDAPQHVTLKIAHPHPLLRYIGWHVWHDYLTNPKTVEVASGESTDDMVAQLVCEAVTGAGTQIWKLPNGIPSNHLFVRIKIVETFGPGPTYMNNIVLFANDPGTRFRSTRNSVAAAAKPNEGSMGRMSVLLKELDEDIRALHPIKTVTPKKNMLLYIPQEPMTILPPDDAEEEEVPSPQLRGPTQRQGSNGMNSTPQLVGPRSFSEGNAATRAASGLGLGAAEVSRGFNDRLCALEQAVASLTQSMNHQREDLTMIKRLLLQQASERRCELEQKLNASHAPTSMQGQQQSQQLNPHRVSRHQVSVDFPEDALRSFVESVVAPKLHRHAKRTEAQTIAKLDEFLKDIVTEMTHAVDDRVRLHIQQASSNGSGGGNLAGLPPYAPDGRKAHPTHTPPQGVKSHNRSAYADYSAPATASAFVPQRQMTSFSTPPVSSVGSPCGKDVGSIPVSIIRDMSTEADPSYARRAGATSR